MASYGVNNEGVAALRGAASNLSSSCEEVLKATIDVLNAADENRGVLGPHSHELAEACREIKEAVVSAAAPIDTIRQKLEQLAAKYEVIIERKLLKETSGSNGNGVEAAGKKPSLLGRVFGGKGLSGGTAQKSSGGQEFSGVAVEKLPGTSSTWTVKGRTYDSYLDHWENADSYTFDRECYGKNGVLRTVDPSIIEGVHIDSSDIEKPETFWSMHRGDGTGDYFGEAASHIPEVQAALDRGVPLSSLISDPVLGSCAQQYFNDPVKVYEGNGYYEFDSDGRHRIIAAKRFGHRIPVRVIGRIIKK